MDLSQSQLAEKLGVNRERIASYEQGRAPLRWDLAIIFCAKMDVNELWLFNGVGLMHGAVKPNVGELLFKVPISLPFSRVFEEHLSEPIIRRLSLHDMSSKKDTSTRDRAGRILRVELLKKILKWSLSVPTQHMQEFSDVVENSALDYLKKKRLKPITFDEITIARLSFSVDALFDSVPGDSKGNTNPKD